jgi:hypothetical protein
LATEALLAFAGEVYFPFLLANARAVRSGDETFAFTVGGQGYAQGAFKYQQKCLEELRRAFVALPAESRERISGLLDRTGCLEPLEAPD